MIQQIVVYLVPVFIVFFAFVAIIIVGCGVWRLIYAIRNPEGFKQIIEKEAARKQQMNALDRERIAQGKPSWMGRCFAAVFTIAGSLIVAHTVWLGANIATAKIYWTRASCAISEKRVDKVRSTGRNSSTFYAPFVKYSYSLNGQTHVSTRLDFANNSYLTELQALYVLAFYSKGTPLTCYVNPQNSSEAVLDAEFSQLISFNRMGGMITCLTIGGFLFYFSRRRQPKSVNTAATNIKI